MNGISILVTGSRNWTDKTAIVSALLEAAAGHTPDQVAVTHGACPTGADRIAAEFARSMGWCVVEVRAPWEMGRRAGPWRNQKMIDLRPDVVCAFPLGESRGTRDCMRRAEAAGIPVRVYEQGEVR